jgi:hypothetical protein
MVLFGGMSAGACPIRVRIVSFLLQHVRGKTHGYFCLCLAKQTAWASTTDRPGIFTQLLATSTPSPKVPFVARDHLRFCYGASRRDCGYAANAKRIRRKQRPVPSAGRLRNGERAARSQEARPLGMMTCSWGRPQHRQHPPEPSPTTICLSNESPQGSNKTSCPPACPP